MSIPLEKTLYHSFLRVAVCVMALILVFDSGLVYSSTADISELTQIHLANVIGITAGVNPNDVNVLTAKITELESDLKKEREISVNLNSKSNNLVDNSTFILSIILFILLVLIVLNYVLDFVRSRKLNAPHEEVTL